MDPNTWNSLTQAERDALLDGPALKPPPGVMSNFDNPSNRDGLVLGVTITSVILTTSFALIRVYARACVTKSISLVDVLALLAFGAYIGAVWSIILPYSLGAFYVHQWDITLRVFLDAVYGFYFLPVFYSFSMLFAKTAILREWLHIFAPTGTRNFFFWICWTVLLLNAAFYISSIFVVNLSCRPARKFWLPWTPGRCFNRRYFDFSTACINLALDLAILIVPQRVIWNLNMSFKRKLEFSLVFSIGLLTCAAATARVIAGRALINTVDRTWDSAAPALCVLAEMTGVLLIFCVPVVPKAFKHTISISQIVVSLRSWTRIGTRNRSAESHQSEWNRAPKPKTYRKINEEPQVALMDLEASKSSQTSHAHLGGKALPDQDVDE